MLFLNEGTKILFRVGYAVMKRLHETIMTISDPTLMMKTCLAAGPHVINDSDWIIKMTFRLRLSKTNNTYTKQKTINLSQKHQIVSNYILIKQRGNV
jgi:hypothetical protein